MDRFQWIKRLLRRVGRNDESRRGTEDTSNETSARLQSSRPGATPFHPAKFDKCIYYRNDESRRGTEDTSNETSARLQSSRPGATPFHPAKFDKCIYYRNDESRRGTEDISNETSARLQASRPGATPFHPAKCDRNRVTFGNTVQPPQEVVEKVTEEIAEVAVEPAAELQVARTAPRIRPRLQSSRTGATPIHPAKCDWNRVTFGNTVEPTQEVVEKVKEEIATVAVEPAAELQVARSAPRIKPRLLFDMAPVAEYESDNHEYQLSIEGHYLVRENFLQNHLTTVEMRAMLVEWLVEIQTNYRMHPYTLHLSVAIVDSFLQGHRKIGKKYLQLVGAAALMVSAKYEELTFPDPETYLHLCVGAYTVEQLLNMELRILKHVRFSLGRPSSLLFMARYNGLTTTRNQYHQMGRFLLDLVLLEPNLSHVRPSLQAAAACCLSRGILDEAVDLTEVWTPAWVSKTRYEYAEIRDVVVSIANLVVRSAKDKSPGFRIIRKKYARSKYGKMSVNPKLNGHLVKELTTTATQM